MHETGDVKGLSWPKGLCTCFERLLTTCISGPGRVFTAPPGGALRLEESQDDSLEDVGLELGACIFMLLRSCAKAVKPVVVTC